MNLHGLRLFHEVAKWGSVTKAAEALRISQPSITAQIKKLEKEEGVQLIEPAGRGIQLTNLGEEVYQHSQRLFAVEEEITRLFQVSNDQKESLLRLGGNYLTVNYVLPNWLASFERSQPAVSVQLATLNSDDLLTALLEGQLDMALLTGCLTDPKLVRHKVYEDRLCLVAQSASFTQSRNNVLELKEVAKHHFIGREGRSFTQQSLERLFKESGVALPRFSLTYNNSREALQATLAGKGVHYCSYLLVKDQLAKGELVELAVNMPIQAHSIYLYYRKGSILGKAGKDFRQLILDGTCN